MNLTQFLHFNKQCPVCNEPLTLYAQIVNGPLWKARRTAPDILHFEQLHCKTESLEEDDFFWLEEDLDGISVNFSSARCNQAAKTWNLFFFFLCNEDSIEDITKTNYGINPYVSCYYRTTPFLEFSKQEDAEEGLLAPVCGSEEIGNIRDEIFTLKNMMQNNDEKVYVLSFDYEVKNTTLRYYQITPEDRKNKYYDPNIFKKDLPLMNVRPNFELANRNQLISRLDSWILLS